MRAGRRRKSPAVGQSDGKAPPEEPAHGFRFLRRGFAVDVAAAVQHAGMPGPRHAPAFRETERRERYVPAVALVREGELEGRVAIDGIVSRDALVRDFLNVSVCRNPEQGHDPDKDGKHGKGFHGGAISRYR